ncbi:hypothetical protein A3Q37_06158 [Streptomyces sp. PTY087I2]|nr:hypothetical protein A3Q37_06158 [Streptomyces sp. PTY087I2]
MRPSATELEADMGRIVVGVDGSDSSIKVSVRM